MSKTHNIYFYWGKKLTLLIYSHSIYEHFLLNMFASKVGSKALKKIDRYLINYFFNYVL